MRLFFAEEFGKAFVPKKIRPDLRSYLFKAGITAEPYNFFGIMFYFSLIVTVVVYFIFFYSTIQAYGETLGIVNSIVLQFFGTAISFAAMMFFILGLIIMFIYVYMDIRIFNRTRKMEEILPDFLEVVSSNLKGGMSFEKSLWMAINQKFGILSNEIALAAKKVMTGQDVDIALTEFSLKYDSPMLKRSMNLIISQIQSGGEISAIIDRVVTDLKKTKTLKEEMSASVLTYMIFIAAIVIVISPVLFALSYALLNVIQSVTALLGASMGNSNASMPISFSDVAIDPEKFIFPFSFVAISITAIGSSMIVSIIEKGNVKGGLKYIPMFLVSSLVIYWIAIKIMTVLSGFIKF